MRANLMAHHLARRDVVAVVEAGDIGSADAARLNVQQHVARADWRQLHIVQFDSSRAFEGGYTHG